MPTTACSVIDSRGPSVVWVTGSSRGIGRAIALAFGRERWRVAVHYREREADAAETVRLIEAVGAEAYAVQADVRDGGQMEKAADTIHTRWHRLDAAVCNAGTATSRLVVRTTGEDWDAMVTTNLTGVYHTLRAAAVPMQAQGGGHILVLGSLSGFQGQTGMAAYAASKAGLLGLVRSAAREWGQFNIRANLILPGWHRTELAGDSWPEHPADDHLLGRTPDLEGISRTVVHLASCRDVSGQVWNLDSRPW